MAFKPTTSQTYVACVPHVPLMAIQGRAHNTALWAAYDQCVEALRSFDPELIIVFGGDHYDNIFLKLAPQFMVGHIAEGVDDVGGKPGKLDVPMGIAKAASAFLVEEGFDVATSHAMKVDHGFTNVLSNFLGALDARPVLPLHINTISDPRPTFKRCRQLGEAVGRFAATTGKRVAFLGSGGLSHQTDFIFPQFDPYRQRRPLQPSLLGRCRYDWQSLHRRQRQLDHPQDHSCGRCEHAGGLCGLDRHYRCRRQQCTVQSPLWSRRRCFRQRVRG